MRTRAIALSLLCLGAWLGSSGQAAAQAPAWKFIGIHLPTHFAPNTQGRLFLIAANVGGAPTAGPITITDTLPVGLDPTLTEVRDNNPSSPDPACLIADQEVTCTFAGPIDPGRQLEVMIYSDVSPLLSKGALPDEATISGGNAPAVTIDTTATIDATPATFGILAPREGGPDSPVTEDDGSAATAAGSHPYQLTNSVGFPTEAPDEFLIGAGHPREIAVDFPRGMVINPAATSVLCTEAQLITMLIPGPGCPPGSQIGVATVITNEAFPKAASVPLFNMVPPPGTAAMVAFDGASAGVFVHVGGEVRSDGDFGLSGVAKDVPALTGNPAFGARIELWGDPADPVHDQMRSKCVIDPAPCSVSVPEPPETALLTLPTACPGKQMVTGFRANSWQQPGVSVEGSYESADLDGDPVVLDGCNALGFEPEIEAKPTTNLADQPSGFEFAYHHAIDPDLGAAPTANLKDATLTLPEGLVVNPSAAQGQKACSAAEIGLTSAIGQSPVRFSKDPATCPEASKIGSLEVKTPLLAEVDESKTKVQRDPETGHPIPRTIEGSLYLAKPFDNPFDSLLALYLYIEDPLSGTVAKFAARVSADKSTGRLANTLLEGPDLPIEDVRVRLFTGSRAALRTPPACATYTTAAELVPWSAPEGPTQTPSDSFAITAMPAGGACPAEASAAPNQPAFSAGTITPQAGSYSPFVLKVSREDASQPLAGFEATLPPGLSAKLLGVATCSEAEIARAQGRNQPNQGALERDDPSCPAASEVGTVTVAAGAGPTPLHTSGRVYLAPPYKGAPLSAAIITPAIAGPFDLGAVVVRTALYVNPITAQVRAVSDPLPTILEGIPLDVRSAFVKMGRPQFTLNPTSCEPSSVSALATSVFGQGASLTSPFQVGGCETFPFKPKLTLRMLGGTKRGGHPRFRAILTPRAGDANIASATISLPRSQFVDQAHIRTVCTRVQFAAEQCPKGAIYGEVKASTPLLEEALEGPVYLRSSDNELPDAVAVLRGPPSRPIEIEGVARIDSQRGRGVRINIDTVPDAPIGKVVVTMQGGRKGLLINSRDLCARSYRAQVKMRGQNGKAHNFSSVLKNDCKKRKGGKKGGGKGRR